MPTLALRDLAVLFLLAGCAASAPSPAADTASHAVDLSPVPLVGEPCEGCEAAFDGAPGALSSDLLLAPVDEPGERLQLRGRVVDRQGRGVEGVVLYMHQTDHAGRYPAGDPRLGDAARRHGRLRGWLRSGADGTFQVDTIRPGAYPGTDIPQHIHVQVIEPSCATYYVDDLMFRDDPRLTVEQTRRLSPGVGGDGVVSPRRVDGAWQVERGIVLGRRVARYPACGRG